MLKLTAYIVAGRRVFVLVSVLGGRSVSARFAQQNRSVRVDVFGGRAAADSSDHRLSGHQRLRRRGRRDAMSLRHQSLQGLVSQF